MIIKCTTFPIVPSRKLVVPALFTCNSMGLYDLATGHGTIKVPLRITSTTIIAFFTFQLSLSLFRSERPWSSLTLRSRLPSSWTGRQHGRKLAFAPLWRLTKVVKQPLLRNYEEEYKSTKYLSSFHYSWLTGELPPSFDRTEKRQSTLFYCVSCQINKSHKSLGLCGFIALLPEHPTESGFKFSRPSPSTLTRRFGAS